MKLLRVLGVMLYEDMAKLKCGVFGRCGERDEVVVRNVLRIVIRDESEVKGGSVGGR